MASIKDRGRAVADVNDGGSSFSIGSIEVIHEGHRLVERFATSERLGGGWP